MRAEWYTARVERAKALLVTRRWPRDGTEGEGTGELEEL